MNEESQVPETGGESPLRRVAIVDDHSMILESMTERVRTVGGHVVVLAETDPLSFIEKLAQGLPMDVAIVDARMPHMNGYEVLRWMGVNRPDIPVLMLSAETTPGWVHKALHYGAKGYLPKYISTPDLGCALTDMAERGYHRSPVVIDSLERAKRGGPSYFKGGELPPREKEFLDLLLDPKDLTYAQIADRMGVTVSSVERCFRWFGENYRVHSRAGLVRLAMDPLNYTGDGVNCQLFPLEEQLPLAVV